MIAQSCGTIAGGPRRILLIDSYDSFTYNLVQQLGTLGGQVTVVRNDGITLNEIAQLRPSALVFSPGPGRPTEAGVLLEVIRRFAGEIPMLGVCLGHQAIGEAFGGEVVGAERIMHGKTSPVLHDGQSLFEGVATPITATRYHSLIVRRETLPACLEVSAWTTQGEVMGLRHREHNIEGIQFHPESFLTDEGDRMIANFLAMAVAT
ncbi:MAG: aminodeoxychorismate/anthranilate synthase component II [Anaerolineae bacterium]|nr:aminodeoxychorismate/anthranilate synthase component II [Gemmatimonadaceae bacterium]